VTRGTAAALAAEPESHWLRVGEAARELRLGEKRVRELADRGELEMVRTALGRLISPQSLLRYKQTHPDRYRP
jgi:excisionase family DNA binding protein